MEHKTAVLKGGASLWLENQANIWRVLEKFMHGHRLNQLVAPELFTIGMVQEGVRRHIFNLKFINRRGDVWETPPFEVFFYHGARGKVSFYFQRLRTLLIDEGLPSTRSPHTAPRQWLTEREHLSQVWMMQSALGTKRAKAGKAFYTQLHHGEEASSKKALK
jgi:hypothetical protein